MGGEDKSAMPRRSRSATELPAQDIQRSLRAVAHAIAQQDLEGLKVTPATVADLHRAARGEIGTDEVIRNIYARLEHVPPLRS